ncbi:MAG: sugar transferase [Flavobacteriales bacterium]|tara:strand:+ start:7992 stop:8579 length:588 start_codon:yes stop_codon:yes gene_type:complete
MIKRLFDVVFSLVGIVFLLPIFIVVSFLIKIDSSGPIFFLQKRVGLNGDIFKIIKFRTMRVNHNNSLTITLENDVRITRIGKILRKYKIDEIPELINVLIGDMSFVGPRPDVPGYADLLKGNNRNILKLRPGITSKASIKYANEEQLLLDQQDPIAYNNDVIFPDKVKMNLNYYENNNIWIDIKIIFATLYTLFE